MVVEDEKLAGQFFGSKNAETVTDDYNNAYKAASLTGKGNHDSWCLAALKEVLGDSKQRGVALYIAKDKKDFVKEN